MRHAATSSLLTRRDVVVVASISCIYGIGAVEDYVGESLDLQVGQSIRREILLRKLTEMLYERNDYDLGRLRFRARGDIVDLVPAGEEQVYRIELFGDEVERIRRLDPVTGEILGSAAVAQGVPRVPLRDTAAEAGARGQATSRPSSKSGARGSTSTTGSWSRSGCDSARTSTSR